MNIIFVFLLIAVNSFGIFASKVRYDGFQVYRVTPTSKQAVDALRYLEETDSAYDFWSAIRGVGQHVDIMVPPHYRYKFNDVVGRGEFQTEVFITDVQKLIDNEKPKNKTSRTFDWTHYQTLDSIYQYLHDVEEKNAMVTLINVGKSHEERDISGVKISFAPGNEDRTVFIEANIHAREWITSAVATWIINELLTNTDDSVRKVVESHDWIIVPVFNPDGFVYSHETDRMWRKTRTPYFLCFGVDPNRNWGYHFNEGGTSTNPCSNTYRGPEAFSDPSTNSVSEYLLSEVGSSLQAYIALHSYSQMLLLPYGYSSEHLGNYDNLKAVGLKAAESLKQRHGTEYEVGNIVELLYVASGGSMDWVKGTFDTTITYTYELRDKGEHGFILPADQIIPCAEETFDSLVTILDEFDKL